MKLLFNNDNNGQEELKTLLGYLDADITYGNLEADIELSTPYLIDHIGQEVYDRIETHYSSATPSVSDKDLFDPILKNAQLFIAIKAYLSFAPNHDLMHGNSGRKVHNPENQKIPWDWQIAQDNAANYKRAYRALDLLFIQLDDSSIVEWTSSESYKKAKSLFVYNTKVFDDNYPINKSGMLYYKLVPFLTDVQKEKIFPILGKTTYDLLISKLKGTITEEEAALIRLAQKVSTYNALAWAFQNFPVEMLPMDVNYRENTTMKSKARAEVTQNIQALAEKAERDLEREYNAQNGEEYEYKLANERNESSKKYFNA